MTEARFWEIIDATRADATDAHDHSRRLGRALRLLTEPALESFEEIFWDVRARADLPELRRLMRDVAGTDDDEAFMDVKDWIVSLGRARFEAITQRPDLLLEHQSVLAVWDIPHGTVYAALYDAQTTDNDDDA
ncbi:MAG: DUF4240 domain-containing protein [Catalinimonas sp.]